jgi:membrane-bound inhibitor of C-type lysozyme
MQGYRFLPAIACAVLACACSDGAQEPAQKQDVASQAGFSFDCGNAGVASVHFLGSETVELVFAGDTYRLPRERAASGARYAEGNVSFWNKGDEAMLQVDDVRVTCSRMQAPGG